MKVVTSEQMRNLEVRAERLGMPSQALMQNAGKAIAEAIINFTGNIAGQRVLILVGPGNNGGDGLVVGRHLYEAGAIVSLYLWNRKNDYDINLELARERGIPILKATEDSSFGRLNDQVFLADIIVDSLLGTGRARPIEGELQTLLNTVCNQLVTDHKVIAVDLPSGLNPDNGSVDPNTLQADLTVTLGCPKLGLFLPPGNAFVGKLVVGDIGIPASEMEHINIEMATADLVESMLPERSQIGNKGTFGRVIVVGGSSNYVGAPCLAGTAAVRSGAGLVTLAIPQNIYIAVAGKLTESTFIALPSGTHGGLNYASLDSILEALPRYQVLAIGPGIGQHDETMEFERSLLQNIKNNAALANLRLVIDADGLNNLTKINEWWTMLPTSTVLTPHPAELGRLLGMSVEEVQADRLGVASRAANEWQRVVVLKGANTIVADPTRRTVINPGITAALATAGTGDVLTGIIAGLMAQGMDTFEAAVAGVYLHWQTAVIKTKDSGEIGLAASDLPDYLPAAITALGR